MAGKLNGRDAGHDTQGVTRGVTIHAGTDILGELTLEDLGNAAGVFHDLKTALNRTLGIFKRLAVFHGGQRGQLFHVIFDKRLEAEHDTRTVLGRDSGPTGLSICCVLDGRAHFISAGQGNPGGQSRRLQGWSRRRNGPPAPATFSPANEMMKHVSHRKILPAACTATGHLSGVEWAAKQPACLPNRKGILAKTRSLERPEGFRRIWNAQSIACLCMSRTNYALAWLLMRPILGR